VQESRLRHGTAGGVGAAGILLVCAPVWLGAQTGYLCRTYAEPEAAGIAHAGTIACKQEVVSDGDWWRTLVRDVFSSRYSMHFTWQIVSCLTSAGGTHGTDTNNNNVGSTVFADFYQAGRVLPACVLVQNLSTSRGAPKFILLHTHMYCAVSENFRLLPDLHERNRRKQTTF
jgi:hypothetical protein